MQSPHHRKFRDERPLLSMISLATLSNPLPSNNMKKTGCEPRALFSSDLAKAHGPRGLKRSPKACRATGSAAVTGSDGKRAVAAKELLERRAAALRTDHVALFGVTHPDVKLLTARLAAKYVRRQPCTSSLDSGKSRCRIDRGQLLAPVT